MLSICTDACPTSECEPSLIFSKRALAKSELRGRYPEYLRVRVTDASRKPTIAALHFHNPLSPAYYSGWVLIRVGAKCPNWVCAVTRRRFPVGASPTRQMLQSEATGAVMEVTKWLKPSDSGSRIGDRASVQAATRVNAEQASKRTMCRPTRQPFRGRLIRLGDRAETTSRRCTGVVAAACTQGKRTQHGKPQDVARDGQPDTREGSAGRPGVAERLVVPPKPGNADGGKEPQFKTDAGSGEGPGDWATYQLQTVSRSCRGRCTRKRRQNLAIASTRCTTRTAARTSWPAPMPSAAPTRACQAWTAHSSPHFAPASFGMNTPAFDTAAAKFCISGASLCSGMLGMRS